MEVTKIGTSAVKIKTKLAAFAVNPLKEKAKTAADAVLLFDKGITLSALGVEDNPLIIDGPGDYEIKAVKFAGLGKSELVGYEGKFDGMDTLITRASLLTKGKDVFGEYHVVILEEDEVVDQSLLVKLNTNVAIVYGAKAEEHIKTLGKEIPTVAKYTITKDKLPQEMEIVLLQ